jgi:hypothetical protein
VTVVPEAVATRGRAVVARPWIVGELIIIFVLVKVYDYVRSFAELREQAALSHAQDIIDLERFVHLDIEQAANRWLASHESLTLLASFWYEATHIAVTLTVLACCYALRPTIYRAARNALVITNCVGITVYFLLPVMPPRLLPHYDFLDLVALSGYGATHVGPVKEDQFAAMPSLHVAWAVWTAIVLFIIVKNRVWRPLVVLYPLTTAVVVVGTANHYLLDVVVGVAVAVGATMVTGLFKYGDGAVDLPPRQQVQVLPAQRAASSEPADDERLASRERISCSSSASASSGVGADPPYERGSHQAPGGISG